MRLIDLFETSVHETARPAELGEAFFYINGKLVDVGGFRNHRDWLVAHSDNWAYQNM